MKNEKIWRVETLESVDEESENEETDEESNEQCLKKFIRF